MLAHGAVNAGDPGTDDVAVYSSRGPTNDRRLKPDAVVVDGVAVSGAGGLAPAFFGTSAAAPDGAALAALLLQAYPRLRVGALNAFASSEARATLRALVTDTAVDLGAAGPDVVSSAGRIDGARAGEQTGPPHRLAFAARRAGRRPAHPSRRSRVCACSTPSGGSWRKAACR